MPVRYRVTGRRATEIADSVERGLLAGGLAPGGPLPTVRGLAGELGVNPNTVAAAYRLLRDRGVVETAGRRGTRLRERPPATPRRGAAAPPPGARDLASGDPAPDLLPRLDRLVRPRPGVPVLYGAPDVAPALAATAAERLGAGGVPTAHLTATYGTLDAVERVLTAHLRHGDRVAVEDPGWGNLLDLVAALGLVADPVAVDDDGPTPAALAAALDRGARAVVVTARAQNPTGAAIGAARARELRRVLRSRPGVLLVEDDHAAEVCGAPLHSLLTPQPPTAAWAHVRSLAKSYGPDLRLAVLAGDAATVGRVRGRLRLGPGWVSHLLQDAAARAWTDPGADRLVQRAAVRYAARRDGLTAALAARGVPASGRAGLNVWIPVPEEAAAVAALAAAGWAVAPGARFRLAGPPGIRVTVAGLTGTEVPALADAVAAAVRPGTGAVR